MNLVERRKLWFSISLIAILPGILFMIWHAITTGTPLPLAIDYTGGTQWEMRFEQAVAPTDVRQVFVEAGFPDTTAFLVEDDGRTVQLKLKTIDPDQKDAISAGVSARFGSFDERSYRSIGPTIGAEASRAALLAVIAASLLILVYIAFAFREVSHPFRFGTAAIVALIHDVLVTISFLAIMNLIAGWEIDALFLTAALTVIGFSVNDTIVIFDRIRENLRRYRNESYATVTNRSLIETAQRSISTQVTAMLILVAIIIFGGATLQIFMSTLLVGLISGTYSSIFTAAPMVVAWEERALFGTVTPEPATSKLVTQS
ncbi:MAG: protein translocase subunit SecF [Caldilineaceae bacterium]|nr:protein translocase subunit SecF [Caldilineaceae bacterium]HRJ41929.1 protein translocase subunit SecF [Caldilineaceae bacterium]